METEKRLSSMQSPPSSQVSPSERKYLYMSLEPAETDSSTTACNGMGRRAFVLSVLACSIAGSLILVFVTELPSSVGLFRVPVFYVMLGASMLIHASRLRNMGGSPYFSLILLVPGIGAMLLTPLCLCCQEGFAYTHKLDQPGKALAFALIALVLLGVVLAVALPLVR